MARSFSLLADNPHSQDPGHDPKLSTIAKIVPRSTAAVDTAKTTGESKAASSGVVGKAAKAATSFQVEARKGVAVSYKDIPNELKDKFIDTVIPAAKRLAGRQLAFSSITASEVENLINATFPKLNYKAKEGDVFVKLVRFRTYGS